VSEPRFDLAARLSARLANLGQDYCIFTRGERDFAISVSAAREVLTGEAVTTVPQAPPTLVGVLNLRGMVLPLVRLDSLLGMATRPYTPTDHILVLSSDEADVGLVVDRVRDVRSIDPAEIKEYPEGTAAGRLLRGYWPSTTGLVTVLEAKTIIPEAVAAVSVRFQQRLAGQGDRSPAPAGAVPLSNE
jgi:purine-binding chemotaxis protein CheW